MYILHLPLKIRIAILQSVLDRQYAKFCRFCAKIGYHGYIPREIEKMSVYLYDHSGENLAKIGPVDLDIIGLQ